MPWLRMTDTAAMHPIVLAVAEHPQASDSIVNEVFGFMTRLATMSAQYLTDYVFWYSSAVILAPGAERADWLLEVAEFAGYGVQGVEEGTGRRFFKLVSDPEFINIKTAEEVAFERDRKANNGNLAIIVPVRHRDGDACRYCGMVVNWLDRKGGKGGTYDHRLPGQSGTWKTEVVACRSCNSVRGNASKGLPSAEGMAAADRVRPLMTPPDRPYYAPRTREWLNSHADILALHEMRPPDLAPEGTKALRAGSSVRSSSQAVATADTTQVPAPAPVSTGSPAIQAGEATRPAPGRPTSQVDSAVRRDHLIDGEARENPASAASSSHAPAPLPDAPASQADSEGRASHLTWGGKVTSRALETSAARGDERTHDETVEPATARAEPPDDLVSEPDLSQDVRSGQIRTDRPGTGSRYPGSGRDGSGQVGTGQVGSGQAGSGQAGAEGTPVLKRRPRRGRGRR